MSLSSIISMLIILGIVLGGFFYFLSIAIKKEKEKN
ncbi:MetS family NSS transporter small subunit [Flexithrix dorotheae]|nr:MetS family NSS transporter small subunit [Flexithrix dorotheae]